MKTLGKRLRKARDEAGFKQIEAAEKLGISNGTLSGYERDYRDPDTDILHKMATLYDVSVDWLIGKTDDPKSSNDNEIEKILNDPKTNIMFKDWEKMNEDQREEALNFIKFLISKDKK